ncbi:DgyrCDS9927 [Dimorphilus gyrociliatus]|uniref:DgyrCDS9927 n=1 Tax=Dimorphilus gyrociliatus TaxID=2664684 RepID=A0A7I8VYS5_9ANNE|nr:DgyrCDS9927 [Dimorphilus gyrociliatus]
MSGTKYQPIKSNLQVYPVRFLPDEDLKECLKRFVQDADLKAPFILTCCGSLKRAKIRLADAEVGKDNKTITLDGRYEIISLVGTLNGNGHLHISLADDKGQLIGGHVVSDLIIYTTAEVVIGECNDTLFSRDTCDKSGWDELVVTKKN